MKQRILFLAVLCGCLCLLCACGQAKNMKNVTGTVAERSGDRVVVELLDSSLISRIAFTLEQNKLEETGAVVGDTIGITYKGHLRPDSAGDTDVVSWGLIHKEFHGELLSLDETQAVVRPLPGDPLAQQAEEIRFLRNNRDLQREIGVRVGDMVSVLYVRDVMPGTPPQVEAVDWGVYMEDEA